MSDILRLAGEAETLPRVAAPILKRLRASHHLTARLLAEGRSVKETALIVGYSAQRVSDLQVDPTFDGLVTYYREHITEIDLSDANRIHRKMVEIAEMATDEIAERLEDDETRTKMPIGELRQLADTALNRTVLPAKTATPVTNAPTKITFNIGNRDLREIGANAKVIDNEDE